MAKPHLGRGKLFAVSQGGSSPIVDYGLVYF